MGLVARRDRRSRIQRRRHPLPVAQAEAEGFEAAVAVANAENFCLTRLEPHAGHTRSSLSLPRISFSKTFPHFRQAYSKMGMKGGDYSLGASLAFFSCPDGAGDRGAQLKRESPGMRGSTSK